MIKKLFTSNYDKSKGSNITKVTKVITEELTEAKELLATVKSYTDINKTSGKALDLHGENVGILRGNSIDELYRVLIGAKQGVDRSDGSAATVINFINLLVDAQELYIYESRSLDRQSIIITQLPLSEINKLGITPLDFFNIVNQIIAGGVSLEYIALGSTFEYGDGDELAYSETQGYSGNGVEGGELGFITFVGDNLIGTMEYVDELSTDGLGYADVDMTKGGTFGMFYQNQRSD